jgi:putative ABC transport system permease protein
MNEYFKLAWRNIWRNKRRTMITSASVFFAVFFALLMMGTQVGFYGNAVNNIVQTYTGYIQIHAKGYQADPVIDNSFENNGQIDSLLLHTENVKKYVARLESVALASFGQKTKGVMVIGTDFGKEDAFTHLLDKLSEGQQPNEGDAILIAEGLAKFLKLKIGDTLVLLSQGYHGESAAGKFAVKGFLHFPVPDMNNSMVYLWLPTAQQFYSAPGMLTSVAIDLNKRNELDETAGVIKRKINMEKYEVMPWPELLPELDKLIRSEKGNTLIFIVILYLIVGFGIFGTVLMMTSERKREFGVMVAMGMRKFKLAGILIAEMIMMGLTGVISGVAFSLPIIYYFHIHPYRMTGNYADIIEVYGMEPVMPLGWEASYIVNQAVVIMLFVIIASIYPIFKIVRLNPVRAMRGV